MEFIQQDLYLPFTTYFVDLWDVGESELYGIPQQQKVLIIAVCKLTVKVN